MPKTATLLKELKVGLPRQYALWRIGATYEESRAYNTTDRILLTFDDYGNAPTIYGILDVLSREGIKGVFFLQGDWAKRHPKLVQAIQNQGHWLGNHTYSHLPLTKLDDQTMRQQMLDGPRAKLLRPPYGALNKRVRQTAHRLNFKIAYWTIDSWDWKGIDAPAIHDIVFSRLHKGACILLHLNAPHTLEALPALIAGIRARGFELCHDGTELAI